jgi:hypothetical protein
MTEDNSPVNFKSIDFTYTSRFPSILNCAESTRSTFKRVSFIDKAIPENIIARLKCLEDAPKTRNETKLKSRFYSSDRIVLDSLKDTPNGTKKSIDWVRRINTCLSVAVFNSIKEEKNVKENKKIQLKELLNIDKLEPKTLSLSSCKEMGLQNSTLPLSGDFKFPKFEKLKVSPVIQIPLKLKSQMNFNRTVYKNNNKTFFDQKRLRDIKKLIKKQYTEYLNRQKEVVGYLQNRVLSLTQIDY